MFNEKLFVSVLFSVVLLLPVVCLAEDFTFVAVKEGTPSVTNVCIINWNGNNLKLNQCLSYEVDFPGATATLTTPAGNGARIYNVNEITSGFDIELANALLEEAGWVMGPDGIREFRSLKVTAPMVLDSLQGIPNSLIFPRNEDLVIRNFNAPGNPVGGNILLSNNPPGSQIVSACVDENYFAEILFLNGYFLQFQEMQNGRPVDDPYYYGPLSTGIINLDCGQVSEENTFLIAGTEYRVINNVPQTRPFDASFNLNGFTINKGPNALGPWTPTTTDLAFDQRFNTTIIIDTNNFMTLPIEKYGKKAANSPVAVIYGKRIGNNLTPMLQPINKNGTKKGGPKKIPLAAGIWKSYSTVRFPAGALTRD
ncbi:hypothetical protein L0244_10825 [bacterium]|nr:hypothetical protein [bacterium]MCI0613471.1 hypothetical protein [bacterium]